MLTNELEHKEDPILCDVSQLPSQKVILRRLPNISNEYLNSFGHSTDSFLLHTSSHSQTRLHTHLAQRSNLPHCLSLQGSDIVRCIFHWPSIDFLPYPQSHHRPIRMALTLDSVPTELLDMIFGNLDQEDLVKVRLTSKYFDAISSRMLFRNVTIALRRQTLKNLENIMEHPVYRKNVRQITFNTSYYEDFADDQSKYVEKIAEELDKELKTHVLQACHYHRTHMSNLATRVSAPIWYPPSCNNKASCNPKMILHLQSWISECRNFICGSESADFQRQRQAHVAIFRGQQRYLGFLEEQRHISESWEHVHVLERALTYMPQIESFRVAVLNYPRSRTSILFDNGHGHIGFCLDRAKTFPNPDYVIDFRLHQVLRAWNWGNSRLKKLIWKEQQSLWEINSLFSQYGIDDPTDLPNFSQISTLSVQVESDSRLVSRNARSDLLNHDGLREMLENMDALQSLTLFGDHYRSVSRLQGIVPAQTLGNLRFLSIRNMTIQEDDFMGLFQNKSHTIFTLAMDKVYLDEGTWKDLIGNFSAIFHHLKGLYIGSVFDMEIYPEGYTRTESENMVSNVLKGRPNTLGWMYVRYKSGRIPRIGALR